MDGTILTTLGILANTAIASTLGFIFGRRMQVAQVKKTNLEGGKIFEETESIKLLNQKATLEIHKIVVVELKSHLDYVNKVRIDLSKEIEALRIQNNDCEQRAKGLENRLKILEGKK